MTVNRMATVTLPAGERLNGQLPGCPGSMGPCRFDHARFLARGLLSTAYNGAYYLRVLLRVIGHAVTGVQSGTGGVEVPSPEKHR